MADDLARRLVGHPRMRWFPGMRLLDAVTTVRLVGYYEDNEGPAWAACREGADEPDLVIILPENLRAWLPDLSDAPTEGCLFRMLRDDLPQWPSDDNAGERAAVNLYATRVTESCTVWAAGKTARVLANGPVAEALLAVWEWLDREGAP